MSNNSNQAGPKLQTPSPEELRRKLEEMVVLDLLGPAGGPEEEIAEDRVRERYLVGMLAPRQQHVAPEEIDELAVGGNGDTEDGATDQGALPTLTLMPSSLGMTFGVDGEARALRVTARWGRYTRTHSETLIDEKTGNPKLIWKRTPVEGVMDIPLSAGEIEPRMVTEEQPEVFVRGRIRLNDGDWIITLFLVNGQPEPKQRKDEAWLFQPELIVESPEEAPVFVRRHLRRMSGDPLTLFEERSMAMLFRKHSEFAVGHGVAVHADVSADDPSRAVRISSRVVPAAEVPQQTPPTPEERPELADLVLDMKTLSETDDARFRESLAALPDSYEKWIHDQEDLIADADSGLTEYEPAAQEAVKNCKRALRRIQEGIALLSADANAAEAFRFANKSMWLQRVHTIYANQVRRGEKPDMAEIDVPRNRSWYPFQLAFMLLNLPSITDLHHHDRSHETEAIADLLWFPTGGGKTEAYLGLTAYTMGLRRLQGAIKGRSGEYGMAVLMRYTLRVLTLQQFQRATTLICACESIRREELDKGSMKWGKAPFRIGLWVGMKTTPNTTEQAAEAIRQSHGFYNPAGSAGGVGSPAQLTFCPWCGAEISPGKHIKPEPGASRSGRTFIFCGDPVGNCLFSARQSPNEGIPALVVDEEIYRNPPSLMIATVDKFAQMPWKGEVEMLFGQVNGMCPRHGFTSPEIEDSASHKKSGKLPPVKSVAHAPLRPPDLIIQDELHLISGPLGSLVGLYETAVDELASWTVDDKRVRPKVIASTATIKRADHQVNLLFMRKVEIFPPQGTEIGDNFFSIQRDPADVPGRRYMGICATGRRFPAALIRVYVAFLAAAQRLYETEGYDTAMDPWMTLVGYFNSMRELGGTRRLVEDDVSSRLRDADRRGLAKRRRPFLEELTSRINAVNIPRILDRMSVGFSLAADAQRKQQKSQGKVDLPTPLDVLLATNMISVGVDVSRLGLMVVAGQPKTTAEYIQATSRVGRGSPGLVCTVYNWARPRDLSHYERFEHYHATFYQHVEALSLTPFAARALDRGLSAVLVSLIRLAEDEFNGNTDAEKVEHNHDIVQRAIRAIEERGAEIEGKDLQAELHEHLMSRLDHWAKEASNHVGGRRLGYRAKGEIVGLLRKAAGSRWTTFTCLNSLRDVEPDVNLILDERGDLGDGQPIVTLAPEQNGADE